MSARREELTKAVETALETFGDAGVTVLDAMYEVAKDAGMERPKAWAIYTMAAVTTGLLNGLADRAVETLQDTLDQCYERAGVVA